VNLCPKYLTCHQICSKFYNFIQLIIPLNSAFFGANKFIVKLVTSQNLCALGNKGCVRVAGLKFVTSIMFDKISWKLKTILLSVW